MNFTKTFTISVTYDPDALDSYIADGAVPHAFPKDGHSGVIADEIKSNLESLDYVERVSVTWSAEGERR